jgi:hypothetical protein
MKTAGMEMARVIAAALQANKTEALVSLNPNSWRKPANHRPDRQILRDLPPDPERVPHGGLRSAVHWRGHASLVGRIMQ